jgi:hypothetical protein
MTVPLSPCERASNEAVAVLLHMVVDHEDHKSPASRPVRVCPGGFGGQGAATLVAESGDVCWHRKQHLGSS